MSAASSRFGLGRLGGLRALFGARSAGGKAARPEGGAVLPVRDRVDVFSGRPAQLLDFDRALVAVVLGLLALGLVMVYSASIAIPDGAKHAPLSPTHYLSRHALSIAIGLVAALLVVRLPVQAWEDAAPAIFIFALVLLALVLLPLPFLSKPVNGARRWLQLVVLNFQPSELAKLAMAAYAASYMVRKMDVKERFFKAVWPMALALAFTGLLLLAEPDMGAFVVIAVMALGVLFLGGVNLRMFVVSFGVLLCAFGTMILASPWRRERIFAFLHPWDPVYAQGKGYQLTHSLIAFGRGELTGQGLGASVEKLHYLPEAHTDFLLAVIGEELGFLGVAVVIVAFFWLTRRIFVVGRQAIALDRVFAGLMVQGIGIWMGVQALINIGVNLGALPTKGLTLPLMSFGGSAILMYLVSLALVVRVDIENRALMRGGRA